jgi:CBS domain-containing protein
VHVADLVAPPVVAYPDEPLRAVIYRMAQTGFARLPVVERANGQLVGLVTLRDLLKAISRHLESEQRRERVLAVPLPRRRRPASGRPAAGEE